MCWWRCASWEARSSPSPRRSRAGGSPDLPTRLPAPAKPQVLGLVLMLTGMAVSLGDPRIAWTCVLVLLFQMITAPIGAHMAARAGYRTGKVDSARLIVDEYRRDLAASQRDDG